MVGPAAYHAMVYYKPGEALLLWGRHPDDSRRVPYSVCARPDGVWSQSALPLWDPGEDNWIERWHTAGDAP